MQLETLLPLGKVDPGLRAPEMALDLHTIAAEARLLEEIALLTQARDDRTVPEFPKCHIDSSASRRAHEVLETGCGRGNYFPDRCRLNKRSGTISRTSSDNISQIGCPQSQRDGIIGHAAPVPRQVRRFLFRRPENLPDPG